MTKVMKIRPLIREYRGANQKIVLPDDCTMWGRNDFLYGDDREIQAILKRMNEGVLSLNKCLIGWLWEEISIQKQKNFYNFLVKVYEIFEEEYNHDNQA